MAAKHALLAINTGTLSPLSDAAIAKYDYVITQFDRQSRIAGVKAVNPSTFFIVYQNSLLANAVGSSGVSKAQMDANPSWFLRSLQTEPYESSVLRDSPLNFWKMQETSGTTAADAGSANQPGTYTANQTLNQASLTGNAALKSVSFADVGGFATGRALSNVDFTVCGWAVRTNTTNRDTLIGSNGTSKRIILALRAGTADVDFWSDSTVSNGGWGTVAPAAGTLFHWAMTWKASTKQAELFINGVSKGTITLANAIDSATVGSLSIGAWHSDLLHDPMNGRISHVSYFNSVVSAARIAAWYANGPNTTTGGGAIIESTPFPNNWLCDPGNTGYQAQWISNVNSVLTTGGWDAVMADDVDFSPSFHTGTTIGDPDNPYNALTDQKFRDRTRAFLAAVYPSISSGKKFYANISNQTTHATWDDWITLMDGVIREFWKKFGSGDSSSLTPVQPAVTDTRMIDGDFDYDQGYFTVAQTAGKVNIPITYSVATDQKVQRYGWAAFLLDWNGTSDSAYCFAISGTPDPYSVYWFGDVGTPTGAKYNVLSDANCWQRDYTKGVVCVNSSASTKVFSLTAYPALKKADGTAAGTSLSLPAGEAEILTFTVGLETGTGTDSAARSAAIPSAETGAGVDSAVVSGSAPVNTSVPSISGTAQASFVLSATTGSWSNSPTSYAYQWLRCDSGGASCVAIPGATSPNYTVQNIDVGSTLRVRVTATNPFGAPTADSLATAVVIAAPVTTPSFGTEVLPTDAELSFIDEEPPGFFPENQDSNFGIRRKLFSDLIQQGADDQAEIFSERFVATSSVYLDEWEKMMGLPLAPTLDPAVRRSRITGRLSQGPFTREARRELVEKYIQATFGALVAFTSSGIPIFSGIPLHAGLGVITQLYRIYENVPNFSYAIWIDSTATVDLAGLTRELTLVTPSGISFTIDQAHTTTGLIDWNRTVVSFQPTAYWPLASDYNDYGGLGLNGTVTGAPTAIAGTGLITAADADAARDFSGTAQYVTVADTAVINVASRFSMWAVARPDALPSSGNYFAALALGNNVRSPFIGIGNFSGTSKFVFRAGDATTGITYEVVGTTTPVIGTTYNVVGVFDGSKAYLYVNGVLENSLVVPVIPLISGAKTIAAAQAGSAMVWNGGLDEVMFFNYPLSASQILYLSKQAKNQL